MSILPPRKYGFRKFDTDSENPVSKTWFPCSKGSYARAMHKWGQRGLRGQKCYFFVKSRNSGIDVNSTNGVQVTPRPKTGAAALGDLALLKDQLFSRIGYSAAGCFPY